MEGITEASTGASQGDRPAHQHIPGCAQQPDTSPAPRVCRCDLMRLGVVLHVMEITPGGNSGGSHVILQVAFPWGVQSHHPGYPVCTVAVQVANATVMSCLHVAGIAAMHCNTVLAHDARARPGQVLATYRQHKDPGLLKGCPHLQKDTRLWLASEVAFLALSSLPWLGSSTLPAQEEPHPTFTSPRHIHS